MLLIYPGRVLIAVAWILSPPILLALCLRETTRSVERRKRFTIALVVLAYMNWIAFLAMAFAGQIGGFGTHFMTSRAVEPLAMFALVLLIVSPFLATSGRGKLGLSNGLVFALWAGSLMVA